MFWIKVMQNWFYYMNLMGLEAYSTEKSRDMHGNWASVCSLPCFNLYFHKSIFNLNQISILLNEEYIPIHLFYRRTMNPSHVLFTLAHWTVLTAFWFIYPFSSFLQNCFIMNCSEILNYNSISHHINCITHYKKVSIFYYVGV